MPIQRSGIGVGSRLLRWARERSERKREEEKKTIKNKKKVDM
jgi:hypothetical protein